MSRKSKTAVLEAPEVAAAPQAHSAPNTTSLEAVPWGAISPTADNARTHFEPDALAELAASIRQVGILQPLVVRPHPRDAGRYLLVAGERRWHAAQLAGLETVPVRLVHVDDATALRLGLIENLQRRDLDALEEAEGYARLNRTLGMRQVEIADAVHRSQPWIANRLRLLELPEDARARIRSGQLSVAHGVALARYKEFPPLASYLAEQAATLDWTSKELEGDIVDRMGWQLQQKRLIVAVDYNAIFDRALCAACPFGAYRKGRHGDNGYCLHPPHFDELTAAARAAMRARVQAQVRPEATAIAATAARVGTDPSNPYHHVGAMDPAEGAVASPSAPTLPHLRELHHNSYERIYGEPEGCSRACKCRGQAIGDNGSLVEICVSPKRLNQLRSAGTRREKKEQREGVRNALDRLRAAVERREVPTARDLAVLVAAALRNRDPKHLVQAFEHSGGLLKPEDVVSYYSVREDAAQQLAALAPNDLLRLGLEAVLGSELRVRLANGDAAEGAKTVRWWLGCSARELTAPLGRPLVETVGGDGS